LAGVIVVVVGFASILGCSEGDGVGRGAQGSKRAGDSRIATEEVASGGSTATARLQERVSRTGVVDDELRSILARMNRARTREEAEEAARALAAYEAEHPEPQGLAEDPRVEKLGWAEVSAWWPYRPLLRSADEPQGSEEVVLAFSETGGRRGDPKAEVANVYVVYQLPGHTVNSDGYFGITDSGGLIIQIGFVPPAFASSVVDVGHNEQQRAIVVRGRPATIATYTRERTNVDWRFVVWREAQESGGVVRWQVGGSPRYYSEESLIAFVNNLVEVQ
jgi:hypothetical protein